MSKDLITQALRWRYAVQNYDQTKLIEDDKLNTILESGRLAPSSFGLEPWKFIVVDNPEVRKKIRVVSYDQPKVTDASKLIVITYRTDAENVSRELIERHIKASGQTADKFGALKQMVEGSIGMRKEAGTLEGWIKAQSYIPLGIMVQTSSLLGVDSSPMEGFAADEVDKILGLDKKNLKIATMLALGYRLEDNSRPKVRRDFEDAVEFVK